MRILPFRFQMKSFLQIIIIPLAFAFLFQSCESYIPYPRKMGFPRIDFPKEQTYSSFSNETCPFNFEYPVAGNITRDKNDSCWVDINYPLYDCKWHMSYRNIETSGKSRSEHFEEFRRLIYKHSKKASQIKESQISFPAGRGVMFEVYGNVGTPAQVFFYDSTETDIMMMSFYFQTAMKNDSLQPVINYMKEEMSHMLETFEWGTK